MSSARSRSPGAGARGFLPHRYQLVRALGSGGMGRVLLVRDRWEGELVALKVCHPRVAPPHIQREFRILRELRHPGIVRARDLGLLPSGATYFTMELGAGQDLARRAPALRRSPAGREELLDLFVRTAEILAYVHSKGLLHLDLKPANIVAGDSRRGEVKLIDFGLFQSLELREVSRGKGTLRFMAPELFSGAPADERSDLYALGVSIYWAYTGTYPVGGRSVEELIANCRRLPPLRSEALPEPVERIVFKLLAKAPGRRFRSAGEVAGALSVLRKGPGRAAGAPAPLPLRSAGEARQEEPDFVGRERERAESFDWIAGIRLRRSAPPSDQRAPLRRRREAEPGAGRGASPPLLILEGEIGSGKSRFLEALGTELLIEGVPVLELRLEPSRGRRGLSLLADKLLPCRPSRESRERFPLLWAAFARSGRPPRRREPEMHSPEEARARIVREALDLLRAVFASGPVVLLIDDLQWADDGLLAFLRAMVEERRMVEEGAGPDPRPRELFAAAAIRNEREYYSRVFPDGPPSGARRVRLRPLPRASASAALARFLPELGRKTVLDLARRCRGNPLLLARGMQAALLGEPRPAELHADMEQLLRARIADLPDGPRSALFALSLLGGRAADRQLAAVARLGPAALREAREALFRAGLARAGGGQLVLEHRSFAEQCIEECPAARRGELQRRAGMLLSREPGRLPEAAALLLRAGLVEEGRSAARQAIAELLEAGRPDEALPLADAALATLREGREHRGWEETAAGVYERCGQLDRAAEMYRVLAEAPGLEPAARMRLLRKRGGALQRMGRTPEADRALAEACNLFEEAADPVERLLVLSETAALKLFQRDLAGAEALARRGLNLLYPRRRGAGRARRLPPNEGATHALAFHSTLGNAALRRFAFETAVQELQLGLRHARRPGSLGNRVLLLNNLGIAYGQTNQLPKALRVYREASEIADRTGDGNLLFSIVCNVIGIHARRGRFAEARDLLKRARSMPLPARSHRARLFLVHTEGLLSLALLQDARKVWEECVRLADSLPDPLFAGYGRLHLLENELAAGRWKRARMVLAELDRMTGSDARLRRAAAARAAFLDALCGKTEEARSRLALAAPEPAAATSSPGEAAPASPVYSDQWDELYAAAASLELGDHDAALEKLRRQHAVFEKTGQPPAALECALSLADGCLRRGDAVEARRWIAAARSALERQDGPSRGSAARLPYLEARAARLDAGHDRVLSDRLADAAGNLASVAAGELEWLLRLVEAAAGQGRSGTVGRARRRFLAGLEASDRRTYAARNHALRLGLRAPEERGEGSSAAGGSGALLERRYRTIAKLSAGPSAEQALDLIRAAAPARAALLIVEGDGPLPAGDWPVPAGNRPVQAGFPRGAETRAAARLRAFRRRARNRPGAHQLFGRPRRRGLLAVLEMGGRAQAWILLDGIPPEAAGPTGAIGTAEFVRAAGAVWLASRADAGSPPRSAEAGSPARGGATNSLASLGALKGLTTATRRAPGSGAAASRETDALGDRMVFGDSPAMKEIEGLVHRARGSDLPVLIIGESGVGKELLARTIHSLSPRRDQPFLAQNCSAIPEGLVEADLFGYKRGAFSGADTSHTGFLFAAEGGMFYLDGVDELSSHFQAKLLRLLESREVRPVGADHTRQLNVRFIASSQRDLQPDMERGAFRPDLYFRLAGICLRVPPLRERVEDIPALVKRFVSDLPGSRISLTPEAMRVLQSHVWPGNVRELEAVVRRLAFAGLRQAGADEVAQALGSARPARRFPRWLFEGRGYRELLRETKREYILHVAERCRGDLTRIARKLGVSKRTLYLRLAAVGLSPDHLRAGHLRGAHLGGAHLGGGGEKRR